MIHDYAPLIIFLKLKNPLRRLPQGVKLFLKLMIPLFSTTQNSIFVKTKNAKAKYKYKKGFVCNIDRRHRFAPPYTKFNS